MHRGSSTLGIRLETDGAEPLYQQIFDTLARRIREGTLPPGYRLPASRVLAEAVGTHRNTVVRAYRELEQAGFVTSGVGRGTFVADAPLTVLADAPPSRAPLPWGSLTARVLAAEPLGRADRLSRPAPGRDVVDMTRMQPPEELIPHELFGRCVAHVIATRGARALQYAPREGVPRLREQIARDLARQGVPTQADDILVTSGSQQALDMVVRALVDPGEPLLTHGATYSGALRLFAAAGARPVAVPEDAEGPTIDGLRATGRGARLLYLMPNHANPTGTTISAARREDIVDWSHETSVPVLEDDYASDLVLDEMPPLPAMRALSAEVIHVGTYSKKLIPALRVGYLVCPPRLRPHLANLKHAMDLGGSALLQHALAELLERDWLVPHLGRVQKAYRERRAVLGAALERSLPPDVRFRCSPRGVAIWIDLPEDLSPEAVYEEGLRHGVLVSPGTLHRVQGGQAHGLRVNFCYEPPPRLREGARRLARAIGAARTAARGHSADHRLTVI